MAKERVVQAGDPCPIDGGQMVPDPEQDPERQIENRYLNSPNPAAAQRYEKQVRAKVDDAGVIHKCDRCGYRARFKTADAEAQDREREDADRSDRDRQRERDTAARDEDTRIREERAKGAGTGTTSAANGPAEASGGRARRPAGSATT